MRKSIPSPRGAARSRLLAGVLFGLTLAWQTNAFAALPTGDDGVPDLDDENNAPRVEGAVDPASASAVSPGDFVRRHAAGEDIARRICPLLESAAVDNDLPVDFFLRLIWQESRFDTRSVSHAGAKGIAQFMPATARMRGLI